MLCSPPTSDGASSDTAPIYRALQQEPLLLQVELDNSITYMQIIFAFSPFQGGKYPNHFDRNLTI